MAFKLVPVRAKWARDLAVVRVVLGLSSLATEWYFGSPSIFFRAALLGFVAYSLAPAGRKNLQAGIFGLLALFVDTLFFLALAYKGSVSTLWLPALFYLYLLAGTIVLYSPREVFLVVGVCVIFFGFAWGERFDALRATIVVAGALACASAIKKGDLEDQLETASREAQSAREAATKARQLERQNIAADFHDGPLQSFISFQMRLEILRRLLDRDPKTAMQELQDLQELSQSQVRELRAFVRSMRPLDIDGSNLAASARRIAEDFEKQSGIPVTFVGGDAPLTSVPELCAEILKMIREALNNVQKHSRASRVALAMEKTGRTLEISVDDNGGGFPFCGSFSLKELDLLRLGPVSLKQRARSLHGDLILDSRPGRGVGLKIKIPI